MVHTRQIEIRSIYETKLGGGYPDVPIANGIDMEALTASDREAGRKPFFVTLPLGEANQVSHNRRRYKGDVAIKAINEAINKYRITGRKGHTFWLEETPEVFRWIGAIIKDGVAWGKAYIIPTKEGLDLREVYRTAMATNATVATSLQGRGSTVYLEDEDIEEVIELTVSFIDAVAEPGVEMAKAVPYLTHETLSAEDELTQRLNQAIESLADDALPRVDIIGRLADATGASRHEVNEVLRGRAELAREHVEAYAETLTIDQDDLMALAGYEVEFVEEAMGKQIPLKEGESQQEDVDIRLIEMEESHADAIREKDLEIAQLKADKNKLAKLREHLGVGADVDIIKHVLEMQLKLGTMENRVKDLSEASVTLEVREYINIDAVPENMKTPAKKLFEAIVRDVLAESPATEDEVKREVKAVLERPEHAESVKWIILASSGPAQKRAGERMGEQREGQVDAGDALPFEFVAEGEGDE